MKIALFNDIHANLPALEAVLHDIEKRQPDTVYCLGDLVGYEFGTQILWLLLVHGSPRRINEYLFEDRPDSSFLRMMEQADADIMAFGHTHKPFHKRLAYMRHRGTNVTGMPSTSAQ